MKLPAAAIAAACLVRLVLISRAFDEACEEDSLLQTWQEGSASHGHIAVVQLKDDALCKGRAAKPDYQCFSHVILPEPREAEYGYCLDGEYHFCGDNPSSCDSTRRPPRVG
ncbi:unnamed protein product [Durusdinium trenchii]|uniref:Uncharacterized protein n=1 Tax=Durusdinium trenchii TaxID=1381693 RepID=A0ABP0P0L8_9DINO